MRLTGSDDPNPALRYRLARTGIILSLFAMAALLLLALASALLAGRFSPVSAPWWPPLVSRAPLPIPFVIPAVLSGVVFLGAIFSVLSARRQDAGEVTRLGLLVGVAFAGTPLLLSRMYPELGGAIPLAGHDGWGVGLHWTALPFAVVGAIWMVALSRFIARIFEAPVRSFHVEVPESPAQWIEVPVDLPTRRGMTRRRWARAAGRTLSRTSATSRATGEWASIAERLQTWAFTDHASAAYWLHRVDRPTPVIATIAGVLRRDVGGTPADQLPKRRIEAAEVARIDVPTRDGSSILAVAWARTTIEGLYYARAVREHDGLITVAEITANDPTTVTDALPELASLVAVARLSPTGAGDDFDRDPDD